MLRIHEIKINTSELKGASPEALDKLLKKKAEKKLRVP